MATANYQSTPSQSEPTRGIAPTPTRPKISAWFSERLEEWRQGLGRLRRGGVGDPDLRSGPGPGPESKSRSTSTQEEERPSLPADLARKVRRIEISTRRLVDRGLAGQYHSVFKGRGVEFAEVRPYQPGDDVRSIDWNVTARLGEPFIKSFVEERDLTVFLAIDVSGSMRFGSGAISKQNLAAEVSALLAFAARRNDDRVGAALLADGLELFLQPSRRRNQVLRLIREVLVRKSSGATRLDDGLRAVLSSLRQRSVLFLISDFLEPPDPKLLRAAAARHDLVVVEIYDPVDDVPPDLSTPIWVEDAETGRRAIVGGKRWSRDERRRRAEERNRLAQELQVLGVDHVRLSTKPATLEPLYSFFRQRLQRVRR